MNLTKKVSVNFPKGAWRKGTELGRVEKISREVRPMNGMFLVEVRVSIISAAVAITGDNIIGE